MRVKRHKRLPSNVGTGVLFVSLACASSCGVAQTPGGGALDCKFGNTLASRAFDRVISEKRRVNDHLAYELRVSFWDIYDLASHCPDVSRLSNKLSELGLGKDAERPKKYPWWPGGGQSSGWLQGGTEFHCPPGLKCDLIVRGGSGVSQGHEQVRIIIPKLAEKIPAQQPSN